MPVIPIVSTSGQCGTGNHVGVFTTNMSGANIQTKTFAYTPVSAGNIILFWVVMVPQATSPTTCSLTASGWVFSQIGGIVDGGVSAGCAAMFWAIAPDTTQATITMTWNQNTNSWFNALIDEFSGSDTINPIAGSNSATGTGTPTVRVTSTVNDCMIWVPCNDSVTAVGSIGGITATKGADDTQSDWSEYRLLTGSLGIAQGCTVTGSASYAIGAVAISPVLVGPTAGSVPSGTAATTPAFTAKYLFFDTGDYGIGV